LTLTSHDANKCREIKAKDSQGVFKVCKAEQVDVIFGYPSDHVLATALNNNNLEGTHLTAQIVRNVAAIYDSCVVFLLGKMKAPREPTSTAPPVTAIGEIIHCDILPIPTSIGGNSIILCSVDNKCDYVVAVPMQHKSKAQLVKAMDAIINTYQLQGHTVRHFTSDNEANLKSTLPELLIRKILFLNASGSSRKEIGKIYTNIKI
jgi:hypothetical protein